VQRSYAVVGGGIVGLATARELTRRFPGARVTVLEREPEVGRHQTSHNSGVVHAGLYYPPGSLKADLCARGRTLLQAFCADHDIPYQECGKLVVAVDGGEVHRLDAIETRARANQVPGLRRLDAGGLQRVEPAATGVAALFSPHTAITDFAAVARAMAAELDVRTGFDVAGVEARGRGAVVHAGVPGLEVTADQVVLCAGLRSDLLDPDRAGPVIIPFRGEYWRLLPAWAEQVRGLIYPVPDPRYPFLGVHFTRRVDGTVDVGPNAVLSLAREGYRRSQVDARWLAATLRTPTFWRMARRNWRAGAHELVGSASKRVYARRAARLVPGLQPADLLAARTGVRAQAVDPDGSLVDDFRVTRSGDSGQIMAVRNAPSPAATSSLAIAGYICDHLQD
jgi:L-2-hydroxyglutarate oxidase LhgO